MRQPLIDIARPEERRLLRVSARQSQILALIGEGRSDKEIGSFLGLSTATVKTYLSRLYRDNGLRNRAHAAAVFANSAAQAKMSPDTTDDGGK